METAKHTQYANIVLGQVLELEKQLLSEKDQRKRLILERRIKAHNDCLQWRANKIVWQKDKSKSGRSI